MTQDPIYAGATVALFDARPFFEKALLFGVQHGIIDRTKLDAIAQEAPKGMVQIARYFGNEFLLPDLQLARQRIVNLVGLHLEDASGGDLRVAASLLRDHSFLSRSKAGSDMLKALVVMPMDTYYCWDDELEETQFKKDLAAWSLRSYLEYREERAVREPARLVVDAALWLAGRLKFSADALRSCERHAEAIIRTALIAISEKSTTMPNQVAFEKIIAGWRKSDKAAVIRRFRVPAALPEEYLDVVENIRHSVVVDLPKLMNKDQPVKGFFRSLRFREDYFWVEDLGSERNQFDCEQSAIWQKLSLGANDEGSLLTMFLCVAAGHRTAKTLLTEKSAAAVIRKIRKSGFRPEAANDFIRDHVPHRHQDSYLRLWADFVGEAKSTLLSDHDYKFTDAMALLRRECNVS